MSAREVIGVFLSIPSHCTPIFRHLQGKHVNHLQTWRELRVTLHRRGEAGAGELAPGGGRDAARPSWRPKPKGTRPFRRRPWQAVAASEMAEIRGDGQGAGERRDPRGVAEGS